MRYAVNVPNVGDLRGLVELGVAADDHQWDAFFFWDHLHLPRAGANAPVHDPWVLLGAVAARTEHVRLGTLVTPLPRRRPQKLAKELITLDHLSGGRVVVGLGLGSPPDLEFGSFGEPTDARERAERLDEGIEILDGFLRGGPVNVSGKHLRAVTEFHPAARQRPRPPIWIAGRAPHSGPLRRSLRFDGYAPIATDGGPLEPTALAALTDGLDLPPGFDVITPQLRGATAAEYRDAGATWLVASIWPIDNWQRQLLDVVHAGPERV